MVFFSFLELFSYGLISGFSTSVIDEFMFSSFLVCDDACREVIMDPVDDQLVCRISGHCFDNLLPDSIEPDTVSINLIQRLPTLISLIFLLLSNFLSKGSLLKIERNCKWAFYHLF